MEDKLFFGGFGFATTLAIRWALAAMDTDARFAGAFVFRVQRHAAGALFLLVHGFYFIFNYYLSILTQNHIHMPDLK